MPEGILCIGAAPWHGMWARGQQFMDRLVRRGHSVLYVDPPVTYLSPLKNRALGWHGERLTALRPGLWVYRAPLCLPFGNMYRVVNRLNQRRLARRLRRVIRELGWRPVLGWTYLPGTADLLPHLPDLFWCYDCADEHAAFPGLVNPRVVRDMERELLSRADVVLVSARQLLERKQKYRSDLVLVPNGADVEHFSSAPEGDPPADVRDLPRPVVGYVGAISEWLDQELVVAAARAYPRFSFVLVGPVTVDVRRLRSCPNVHLLGYRDYATLPAYLKAFDLGLIPFKVNALTEHVNPVKLYEYLAAGLPVVATDLPEVRPFTALVRVAGETGAFVRAVGEEVKANSPAQKRARLELAAAHSWDARLDLAWQAVTAARSRTRLDHRDPETRQQT